MEHDAPSNREQLLVAIRRIALICFWLSLPCVLLSTGAFVMDQFDRRLIGSMGVWGRIYIGQGHICWYSHDGGFPPGLHLREAEYELSGMGRSHGDSRILGIEYGADWLNVTHIKVSVLRPLVTSLLILILSAVIARLYKSRLGKAGTCGRCGYDLTGNVSGRCPECGRGIEGSLGQSQANT